jgi:drug/metabolite transporter (DMT)-like permease
MTRRSWALFAAMCVIWGIPYLLIRVAVRDVAPGTLVFLRTAIGGLILLPLALTRGGFRPVLRRWAPLLAFTVLEIAIPWLFLSDAEQHLSSSLTGLLIAAVPLVGVVAARVSGSDERADRLQLLGLLIGLIGVATLVGLDFGDISTTALLELLVVVIGYAVAPVIMSRRLADLPSIPVVCLSLLLVAVGYLPYAAIHPPTHVHAVGWWSIGALGLICTALAFVLFFALITAIGPARATVITYVNPAVAVLFGVVLLNESFTLGMAVGFPLILVGSVLAARRRITLAPPAGPEAAICETLDETVAQSMRTDPDAVSNTAATTPVPSADGSIQSTSTPSSGWSAELPR